MTRSEIAETLWPLVDRMHKGHCWRRTKDGPRCITEPFDPAKLNEHAAGTNVYGLCPIAPGSSETRVALLDFDSHKGEVSWDRMLVVAQGVASSLEMIEGMKPILFSSTNGNGIHLYLVWGTPQDARSVRAMLTEALASCSLKPGTGGVAAGEVEVFPKQDSVPEDGYGSMFILPLSPATKSEHLEGVLWENSPDVPQCGNDRSPLSTQHEAPADLERLQSALDAIPNSGDKELSYDQWRDVVFGIHWATGGSDAGHDLASHFSARSSKHDQDFFDTRVWPHIRSERAGAVITDRTIYALASSYGWQDPAVLDDFDVLEDDEEGAGPASGARFGFTAAAEFVSGARPAQWLVKGIIPHAELVVLYGEPGSGKSFLALDLAAAIANGQAWRGRKTAQGTVAYLATEGGSSFAHRLQAYREHHGSLPSNLLISTAQPRFTEKADIGELVSALRPHSPLLIVVDTLSRVLAGADENSNEDMGRIVAHCSALHRATGATILLVHHSGKDATRGARGWSGLRAAADAEIEVARFNNDRAATVTKQKDGEDGITLGFHLSVVQVGTDADGEAVSSCVVIASEVTLKDAKGKTPKGAKEAIVLEVVKDLQGLAGDAPTTHEVVEAAVAQIPFDESSGKRDTRRQHVLRALESLRERGAVTFDGGHVVAV